MCKQCGKIMQCSFCSRETWQCNSYTPKPFPSVCFFWWVKFGILIARLNHSYICVEQYHIMKYFLFDAFTTAMDVYLYRLKVQLTYFCRCVRHSVLVSLKDVDIWAQLAIKWHPSLPCSWNTVFIGWDCLWLRLKHCVHWLRLFMAQAERLCSLAEIVYSSGWNTVFIGWDCLWLRLSHCVCFPFTDPGLCTNIRILLRPNTNWTAGGQWRAIRWIWQEVYVIRIADSTFK